ncbi:hypothetical protein [Isoptericola aurantiacus]|uniref:hypothetical protein n=1 Tax=Isoptericola aurantiacus TaxID=3377839 RepID=UPI00383BEF0B
MNLIWATRGRSWGFRFLLDGGYADPLDAYERAFAGTGDTESTVQRLDGRVALRLPDPDGRRDHAGRVIPHDVVVPPPLANDVRSVEDGLTVIWPLLAGAFAAVWEQERPPRREEIAALLGDVSRQTR